MSTYQITFIDYGRERSSFTLPGAIITAANFDAQVALTDALQAAVEAVTMGNTYSEKWVAYDTQPNNTPAASVWAQRETKWLVSIVGSVSGKIYQREIPTADLTLLAPNNEDMADGAARTALVDAIQDYFRGDALETGTVTSIKYVGRNT